MFVDPKAIAYFTDEVVLVKINAEEDSALAKRFKISGYPTSLLLDKDGNEIDRIVGYMPTDEYLGTITNYRNGIGTLADLLGKSKTDSSRTLAFDIADKYKFSGRPEQATTWYNAVIDRGQATDSMSGESRMSLGNMFYRAKEYDMALVAYRKVISEFGISMFGEGAQVWSAIVLQKMDDTTGAIEAYETFIKKYPESEDVEYAEGKIKELKGEG